MTEKRDLLPHDLDAEESLLGACITTPAALNAVLERIEPGDFFRTTHGHVFKSMLEMVGMGVEVDQVTLCAQLASEGVLEQVGGKARIYSLAETVPAATNVNQYAKIVRDLSMQRAVAQTGQRIYEMAVSWDKDIDRLVDQSEGLVYGVRRGASESQGQTLKQMVWDASQRVDDARAGKRTAGHSTSYVTLDNVIGGLKAANLSILAARPSVGKTALAVNLARAMAEYTNVAFFSMEMTKAEIHERIYCADAQVGITRLHLGQITDAEYIRLQDALSREESLNLFIDDSSALMMANLRSKVRRWASTCEPGVVMIDYLQLMTGDGESKNYELASITRQLKAMSRDFNCHVMCMSQLSRPEKGHVVDPKPRLSDLRDSGAIEQDADLVVALHPKAIKQEDKTWVVSPDVVQVLVLKNRTGPTGDLEMKFIKEYTLFKEIIR